MQRYKIFNQKKNFTSHEDGASPINNNEYLITDYSYIQKRKNRFQRNLKDDNLDISPKTLVGSSLSFLSEKINVDKYESPRKNIINSKLILLDDISDNSKSTNINHLTNNNKELSTNAENINKMNNFKRKKVVFRDQIKIQTNVQN